MRATEAEDVFIAEGPSIIYREGFYYLFFSGDYFESPLYHVSVARSKIVTGPYERSGGQQFIHTDLVFYILITFNIFSTYLKILMLKNEKPFYMFRVVTMLGRTAPSSVLAVELFFRSIFKTTMTSGTSIMHGDTTRLSSRHSKF